RPDAEGRFAERELGLAEKAIDSLEALISVAGRRHLTQSIVDRILGMKDFVSPGRAGGVNWGWDQGTHLSTKSLKRKLREAFGKVAPQQDDAAGGGGLLPGYFSSPRIRKLVAQLESDSWADRGEATKTLAALKDRRAINPLIGLLEREMNLLRT